VPAARNPRSRSWQLNRLVDEFERRGWRDDGQSAMAVVLFVDSTDRLPTVRDIRALVSPSFVVRNNTTASAVASVVRAAYSERI
jgi:hypothetical protein